MVPSPSEIVDAARASRPRTPRWVWVLSLAIGAVCLAAFAYAMLAGRGTPSHPPIVPSESGLGFGTGVAVGLVMGIGIGFAVARQRRAHSSRKRP